MKIQARVTRYRVEDNKIVETSAVEETTLTRNGDWLHISNCAGSMPVDRLNDAIERGGWYAQAGTQPVYVEPCPHPSQPHGCCGVACQLPHGGWGGRNYPEIFVDVDELKRVQKDLIR